MILIVRAFVWKFVTTKNRLFDSVENKILFVHCGCLNALQMVWWVIRLFFSLVNLSQKYTQPQQIATKGFWWICVILCPLWHYKSLPKSYHGKRSNSCQIQNGGNSLWNAWIVIILQLLAIFLDSNDMWILIRINVHYTTCIYCEICLCSAVIVWLCHQIWPTLG